MIESFLQLLVPLSNILFGEVVSIWILLTSLLRLLLRFKIFDLVDWLECDEFLHGVGVQWILANFFLMDRERDIWIGALCPILHEL